MAFQGRRQSFLIESGLFNDFVLRIFLGQVHHLKQEKLKSAAFLMQRVTLHVFLMSPFSPSDKTH